MTDNGYDLEPDIDEELVDEMRDYSLKKDGDYVQGTISKIERRDYNGRIYVSVELPGETFTQTFQKPSPDNRSFEEIAEEYGIGLIDIGKLQGERVWCTKQEGNWTITIRPGMKDRIKQRIVDMNDGGGIRKLIRVAFAPIIALQTIDSYRDSQRWMHVSGPGKDAALKAAGTIRGTYFALFWVLVIGILLVVI